MNYICNSGGARGSDTVWAETGKEFGVTTKTWVPEDYRNLGSVDKEIVDYHVKEACIDLHRPFNPDSVYYGLIARDYFQAAYSDAIFAIGDIIPPLGKGSRGFLNNSGKETVDGGTGYAVEMGIQMNKPVYVFDLGINEWFKWWEQPNTFLPEYGTPKLTKYFAGIGTRKITPEGIQAIRNVYEKTFGNII